MSKVKRYKVWEFGMDADMKNGEYVLYSDYAKLETELVKNQIPTEQVEALKFIATRCNLNEEIVTESTRLELLKCIFSHKQNKSEWIERCRNVVSQVEKLKAALNFYASMENHSVELEHDSSPVENDYGSLARKTLAELEK